METPATPPNDDSDLEAQTRPDAEARTASDEAAALIAAATASAEQVPNDALTLAQMAAPPKGSPPGYQVKPIDPGPGALRYRCTAPCFLNGKLYQEGETALYAGKPNRSMVLLDVGGPQHAAERAAGPRTVRKTEKGTQSRNVI